MDVDSIIRAIEQAADEQGLPELSKRSGIPYTTLMDWRRHGWRPRAVQVLERLAEAAKPANDDPLPHSEAA
jgi:hypothetical protein